LDKETATAKDVADIIGNTSWAREQKCDECGQYVGALVEIGEEYDYESSIAWVYRRCIEKAVGLFGDAEQADE
jgi:hypothetical protein